MLWSHFRNRTIFLFGLIVYFECMVFITVKAVEEQPTVNNSTTFTAAEERDDYTPTETQSAQCTITAGDVKAQAQATISRTMEGVCSSNEMRRAFQLLENRLLNEILLLKSMVSQLVPTQYLQQFWRPAQPLQYFQPYQAAPFVDPNSQPARNYEAAPIQPGFQQNYQAVQNNHDVSNYQADSNAPEVHQQTTRTPDTSKEFLNFISTTEIPLPSSTRNISLAKINLANFLTSPGMTSPHKLKSRYTSPIPLSTTTERMPVSTTPSERILEFRPVQKKSLNTNKSRNPQRKKTGPRDFEIHKFNNTILTGAEIRIFTYYWKIEHFTSKLKSNISIISSPVFSISGLHLKVKATLNHLNRDYLFLQLEAVSNEQISDNSSVVLETGDMFKEIEMKTLFKHKIVILDQVNPTSDLISQEFLNTKSGFPVPNSAIIAGRYSKDDNILVKIVIFL